MTMSRKVPTHVDNSAEDCVAITLDQDITPTKYLLVGVAGNVAVITKNGSDVTIPVVAGWNPVSVTRVKTTGTTATGLFAAY